MYEIYQNTMCVKVAELIDFLGMPINTYKSYSQRGFFKIVRKGGNGRMALVSYDNMRSDIKHQITQYAGDPYQRHLYQDFMNSIVIDIRAKEFFTEHTFGEKKHLPEQHISLYTMEASIINSILIFINRRVQKARKNSITKIWLMVSKMVNSLPSAEYNHKLPNNVRSLQQKCNKYKQEGYISLIHASFSSTYAEKINDKAKMWIISRWASNTNRCATHAQLLHEYNMLAEGKAWNKLKSPETLRKFLERKEVYHLWYGPRHGELKAKEKFMYQHSTKLPGKRDSLWYSDGTKLNLFYQNEEGKPETINVYEVMDAYSEVFLGFHISKTENYEAQFNAYKMAIQTAGHRPYEIKYDNQGGHKKLENGNFLQKIAHLSIKTKPYNGKSKTIESAFGRFQSQILKQEFNWTGMNITTKKDESRANIEFLSANKHLFPTLPELIAQYTRCREKWNQAPHPKTGIPRLEMYRSSHNEQCPEVSIWDMVELFWIERPKPITVNAYGISFQENKVQYDYMVFTEQNEPDVRWLRKHIDSKVYIKYDPQDMSLIFLYQKDALGLRFLCEAKPKVVVSRATQEREDNEMAFISQINQIEKMVRIETRNEMEQMMIENDFHPAQHGFRTPAIKGIESARKDTYGKIQKNLSNEVIELEEEEISIKNKMI